MKNSFWTLLNRFPPFVCRLLARTDGRRPRAITDEEIALAVGEPLPWVQMMSKKTGWENFSVDQMHRFVVACNLDFCDPHRMKRVHHYLRRKTPNKWAYLRQSPDWKTVYLPLIDLWQKLYGN